jgi:peptidyl-prolyl cis-trans isomerase D
MAERYASLLLEQRSGSVGLVTSEAVANGLAPSEGEVNAFYRANQSRYAVPERRVIRYALFGADQVAAAAQPTEAEIAAAYREGEAKYGAQETRTLSQSSSRTRRKRAPSPSASPAARISGRRQATG